MPTHLSKGSKEPSLKSDKVRLYSMIFCPYAHRAHLALTAKNVPYDPVFINLSEKPEWYTQTVPTGKVPALKAEGTTLYESLIIADYLDEKYPGRKLSASTPLQRALDRIFIESWGKVSAAFYKCVYTTNIDEPTFSEVLSSLEVAEKELVSRGTKYLAGTNPGMIDYMIWPWLERIPMIALIAGSKFVLPSDRFPRLIEYIADMKEDEVIQKFHIPTEKYAKFMIERREGLSTACDIELENLFQ